MLGQATIRRGARVWCWSLRPDVDLPVDPYATIRLHCVRERVRNFIEGAQGQVSKVKI